MSKTKAIFTVLMMMAVTGGAAVAVPSGPFGYDLQADMHRSENKKVETPKTPQTSTNTNDSGASLSSNSIKTAKDYYSFVPLKDLFVASIDHSSDNYTNPTLKSALTRYKQGNYTGCLQELYSYIKKIS